MRTTTNPAEAIGIVALCFGWFILGSAYAVSAGFQGGVFSESGMLELVLVELVLGAAALRILRFRGFDIAALYPHPSWAGVGLGVLVAICAGLAGTAAMAPFNYSRYAEPLERLMGGSPIGVGTLVLVGLVNGTYEEIFLLGFLLRGLRGYGLSVAIGVAVLVRVLYHLYQGPLGAMYVGAFGLVLSLYFAASGRLFPVVFAHALWDIIPFLINSA